MTSLMILVKAMKLSPTSVSCLHCYTEALMSHEKYQDAVTLLKTSLKYQNSSAKSYFLLGMSLFIITSYFSSYMS